LPSTKYRIFFLRLLSIDDLHHSRAPFYFLAYALQLVCGAEALANRLRVARERQKGVGLDLSVGNDPKITRDLFLTLFLALFRA